MSYFEIKVISKLIVPHDIGNNIPIKYILLLNLVLLNSTNYTTITNY